jgi:hypothetical protein
MTISAHRSRLIWTPLLGWALLSGSMAAAQDRTSTQQQPAAPGSGGTNVYGTLTPTPGTIPGVTLPTEGTPAEGTTVLTPAPTATGGTTSGTGTTPQALPPLTLVQSLPSTSSTIIDAPFGTSVPIFLSAAQGSGGAGRELGISLGSFILYPAIDVNVGYDNNVFTTNSNTTSSTGTGTGTGGSATQPLIGTLYTTVAPSLDLRSDWSNHSLHLLAGGLLAYYPNATTQNYQAYTLTADGKIDILTDTNLTWGVGFKQSIEPLGTPNATQASAPTIVDIIPLTFGFYQKFNRVFFGFTGTASKSTYISSTLPTAGSLTADDRGRWDYGETLTLGYEVNDNLSLTINPNLNQVRYLTPVDSLGQSRDSDGQGATLGAIYKFNEINSISGGIGYTSLKTGSLGATGTFLFNLSGSWNGYEPLFLRPNISRSIQQTPEGNYRNYISTTFGLDFSYVIHNEWTMVGGISYSIADYQPVDGLGATPRQDGFFRGQLGFLYSFRPQVQIGPVCEYTQGSTSIPGAGPTYNRQICSVRLTARR